MNEKPKSKWYWRLLRWGLIGLAVLATLAAILVTEENWRGKRDWDAAKRAAAARGEPLDVASVIPPPVADDQNFFFAPIVAQSLKSEWAGDPYDPKRQNAAGPDGLYFNIYRGQMAEEIKQGGSWQKATSTDLKQWQTAYRNFSVTPDGKTNGFPVPAQPQAPAADVLLALSVFDPALAELREASQRPEMRIPLNYDDDFDAVTKILPWLTTVKRCAQFLELRSVAELQNNQSDAAAADVELLARVNDCARQQPFLISHLVRMAVMVYVVQPIYEGLAQHRWTDAQLQELEKMLADQDFLADYRFAMRGEEIFAIDSIEKQRITRQIISVEGNGGHNITNHLGLAPAAFFYQNEVAFERLHRESITPLVDLTNRIASPAKLAAATADVQAQSRHYSPYTVEALMLFPAIAKSVEKFALAQTEVDLARVACALERYRLAHNEYPDSLDTLAPQFIESVPHDVINGQPLHYRRTDDGKFVLYSVGWNETDDGGTVVLNKDGNVVRDKGDWVWKY